MTFEDIRAAMARISETTDDDDRLQVLTENCARVCLERHGVVLGILNLATIDGPAFARLDHGSQEWLSPACLVTEAEAIAITAQIERHNMNCDMDNLQNSRGWAAYPHHNCN